MRRAYPILFLVTGIILLSGSGAGSMMAPGCGSFAQGYREFTSGQIAAAVSSLASTADQCPALADYSLYYLGRAQSSTGNQNAALQSMRRLVSSYPRSLFAARAWVALSQIELDLGQYAEAVRDARIAIRESGDTTVRAEAMLLLAEALAAAGDPAGAYRQFQQLRNLYPRSSSDRSARRAAYELLAAHPQLADQASAAYHRAEAELLIREGDSAAARDQIKAALSLAQPPGGRAEMLWMMAQTERDDALLERATLLQCLATEPSDQIAAKAHDRLGHLYWRAEDTLNARRHFALVADKFPASPLAPEAMLAMGKTYEDDRLYDAARGVFRRLLERYPHSDQAEQARFLIPWSFFMTGRYVEAAQAFAAMRGEAASSADRDMAAYWLARSLAFTGKNTAAQRIYRELAASRSSNYYPALAASKIGADPPLALATDPAVRPTSPPESADPVARFHLERVAALEALGLKALEAAELRALIPLAGPDASFRAYLFGAMRAAGAWYDALIAAVRFEKDGYLSASATERLRYPVAYPDLIIPAARRAQIEPVLVLALIRQESLFDPNARSVSDAQGLMQLMPITASRMAGAAGLAQSDLNLFDPATNVRLGVTYLGKLLAMYGRDRFKAVAAYNAGEHAVDRWNLRNPGPDDVWVENIGFRETRDYVKKVIGGMREYEILYGGAGI